MSRETLRDEHLRVMVEVRALTEETKTLQRTGSARAVGMYAVARALTELCNPDTASDELLSEHVAKKVRELREYVVGAEDERHRIAIEYATETRPHIPGLDEYEELVAIADVAASDAYFSYARASGLRQSNARQYPGSCSPMFYIMQHELRKRGVETQHMWWFEACNNHHFLRTVMPNGDVFFMDPTWQQYLPEESDYSRYPHVLIMPSGHMAETLTAHGVPEARHRSWLAAKVDLRPENNDWYWSRDLQRVFSEDPWTPPLAISEQRFYAESEAIEA